MHRGSLGQRRFSAVTLNWWSREIVRVFKPTESTVSRLNPNAAWTPSTDDASRKTCSLLTEVMTVASENIRTYFVLMFAMSLNGSKQLNFKTCE